LVAKKDAFRRMTRQLQTGNDQVEPISRVKENIVRLAQLFLMFRLRKAWNLLSVFSTTKCTKKDDFLVEEQFLFFSYFEVFSLKKDSVVSNSLTRTKILQPISNFNVKNKIK
jgi:phosphate starvation-inducible membrane PsiE